MSGLAIRRRAAYRSSPFRTSASTRVLVLCLLLTVAVGGCRRAVPPTDPAAIGGVRAEADSSGPDSAGVQFFFSTFDPRREYRPTDLHLSFDDGTGARDVSGHILVLPEFLHDRLKNDGVYATASEGTLQVRVYVTDPLAPATVLADARLALALHPGHVWLVRLLLTRREVLLTAPPINRPDARVVVDVRNPDGQPSGDVAVLSGWRIERGTTIVR